jgi:hypothetical protein
MTSRRLKDLRNPKRICTLRWKSLMVLQSVQYSKHILVPMCFAKEKPVFESFNVDTQLRDDSWYCKMLKSKETSFVECEIF